VELRHLRCFLAVAEELARAAEKLHIEQSPLSCAIKELEEDLGGALFARTTRSMRLTRAGKLTDAACHWSALPPSHSDDFSNASEFIGLDTASLRFTHDVLTMAS